MKLSVLLFLSGLLLLTSAKDYKGAEYRTKTSYLYGRFEVNYKAPQYNGVLASFFTYYDGGGGAVNWNEIDIEILGRYNDVVQFNTITPGEQHHVRHQGVDFNPSLSYNTYAFEWTPDYVAWFINNVEVYRQTGSHIQNLNRSQKIMMNIWNPIYENWAGKFNPETLPAFAYYDWVKYYLYKPGEGDYGTDNNFSLLWSDDFNYFNSDRWAKAAHTFNGNQCDFIPENVVFRDGKLILCLTDAVNIGYTDKKPPVILYARASANKVRVYFSENLDTLSSQVISNYLMPGYTIESVSLMNDGKTVELSVPGLNLIQNTNLLVLNIKDTTGNLMASKAVSIIAPQQLQFPLKISVGSTTAYQDFLTDREFKPENEHGYMDGITGSYGNAQIEGTDDDPVYLTDRYGLAKYCVRLPEGNYDIQLWFSENYFSSTGQRVFDLFADGEKIIEDLDLFASAGFRKAHPLTFNNIRVDDEVLDFVFSAEVNNPLINGIIITPNPVSVKNDNRPNSFKVEQNYPNPFNSGTKIKFNMGEEEEVIFEIYNLLGQKIYTDRILKSTSGDNEITLDIPLFTSGVYLYVIKGKKNRAVNKMILQK
jgi:hypothetical protein